MSESDLGPEGTGPEPNRRIRGSEQEAEEKLRRSEARFRTLVENLPGAVYRSEAEPPWRKDHVSGGFEELTGYPVQEFLDGHRSFWDLIVEDDRERVAAAAQEAVESRDVYVVEYRIRHASGAIRWVQDRGQIIRSTDGSPRFLDGLVLDITDRRNAEEALRESEDRFRTIAAEAPAVTFAVDEHGTFVLSEGRALADLGLQPGEAVGASVHEMYADFPEILGPIEKALRGESSRAMVDVGELTFDTFYAPRFDAEGKVVGVFGMAFDVTESRRLEHQLRQSQKMEAIGTLAGGIAHDFNNILLAMLGTTELALEEAPENSPLRADLQEVLDFGQRAVELIRQLLTYARPAHRTREALDVAAIVDEVIQIARATLPTTIRIERHVGAPGARVEAAPTELHQILLNLVTNAGQAMEETGGALEVRIAQTTLPPQHLGLEGPSWIVLGIRDTGPGMSREVLERIFDPFFTTKEGHRGLGMGLSVVHGLVKALAGGIDVESSPGRGSTFSVYLPALEEAEANLDDSWGEKAVEATEVDGPDHHILVIDDEPGIVRVLSRTLRHLGYRVTAFGSPLEALDAVERSPANFDLVLSDQTMPEFTGVELTREIHRVRPDLPVVLMTGFSHDLDDEKAREIGARCLLSKPISRNRLGQVLREVLDESDEPS